jgi:hypothetical protein
MWQWILTLDRILRGEATQPSALQQDKFQIPVFGLAVVCDMLGIFYGLCMGVFSITPGGNGHPMQMLASSVKVPALFLATLIVTFPSLYVFNALVGSRLGVLSVLRLLIAALAVILAALASIGPIVAFFSFTTISYEFMLLLNVLVFAVAGFLGITFLLRTLHRLTALQIGILPAAVLTEPSVDAKSQPDTSVTTSAALNATSPLDTTAPHILTPHVRAVFRIWLLIFALVGCQMAWVLRPFIGNPDQPFTWFRKPYSNFFQAVAYAALRLF